MGAGLARILLRCLLAAAATSLGGLPAVLWATDVSGTVVAREGSRLVPVFRAAVSARRADGAETLAVARTDREGRFLITDLAAPRIALSVEKPRYFTRSVNGREGESIALDCTVPEDCAGVRFELGTGAVVSGMALDDLGEPINMAMVTLSRPEDATAQKGESGRFFGIRARTDDRGYFRIFGLKPGRYSINIQTAPWTGIPFEAEPITVDVEEGGETHGVQILGRSGSQKRFTVSGKLTGLDLGARGMLSVQLIRALGRGRAWGYGSGSTIGRDGNFTVSDLAGGRWLFSYLPTSNFGFNSEDAVPVGVIDVEGDLSGVVLKPLPPTGFSGTLKFASGSAPEKVYVSASEAGLRWAPQSSALAKAPDFRFNLTHLVANTYTLSIATAIDRSEDTKFFVKEIRQGDQILPASDVVVAEGNVREVELIVSDEFSSVSGRVKTAIEPAAEGGARKGSQFQVGLSGPGGIQAVQADQNGQFRFDRLQPGEYKICAWSYPDSQAIYDQRTWDKAGDAARKFTVESGSDVEIDLTAVP